MSYATACSVMLRRVQTSLTAHCMLFRRQEAVDNDTLTDATAMANWQLRWMFSELQNGLLVWQSCLFWLLLSFAVP